MINSMTQSHLSLRVECYAGHRGEETPRRFHLRSRTVEVEEVVDQWIAPTYRYFKVKGDDNGTYILRHDEQDNSWELTLFESRPNML
ncbi:MAG: hypothetical protein PVG89_13265 [Gammaproteobacteria bacterium]|jgi:hypothetical protein